MARWVWVAVLALAAGGCALWVRRPSSAPEELLLSRRLTAQALGAWERGDLDLAHRLLQAAVKQCSYDPDARIQLAEVLWHLGRRHEAREQIRQAISLAGPEPELLVRRGEMNLAMGQVEQAWQDAQAAIALAPKKAEPWALRAQVWAALGRWDRALADYCQALHRNDQRPQWWKELAGAYWNHAQRLPPNQRPKALYCCLMALEQWEELLQGKEPPLEHWVQKGQVYAQLGRWEDAVAQWQRARSQGWSDPAGLLALAQAQAQLGQLPQAQATLQALLQVAPQYAPAHELLSQITKVIQITQSSYPPKR